MNDELHATLDALPNNPAVVVDLYRQLYSADFFALVQAGTESSIQTMGFLTYDTRDGIKELPLFTSHSVAAGFKVPTDALLAQIPGKLLWPRLSALLKENEIQAAVNPTEAHGIRLTDRMVLMMIAEYAEK